MSLASRVDDRLVMLGSCNTDTVIDSMMCNPVAIDCVPAGATRVWLLDVEGTTTPLPFVTTVLLPAAAAGLPAAVRGGWDTPEVQQVWAAAAAADSTLAAVAPQDRPDALCAHLKSLMTEGSHVPYLQQAQGIVWREGYERGTLRGDIFEDAARVMRKWGSNGDVVAIYSSASVEAQKLLFRYSVAGDLTPCIKHYFDPSTVGPKTDAASYRRILTQLEASVPCPKVVFVSDNAAELAAAVDVVQQGLMCVRVRNVPLGLEAIKQGTPADRVSIVSSFGELSGDPAYLVRRDVEAMWDVAQRYPLSS